MTLLLPSYSSVHVYPNGWEVDWTMAKSDRIPARRPRSFVRTAREWHLVSSAFLRKVGISTPVYRQDSWEVDWEKRSEKMVWARNPLSRIPSAREWHWVQRNAIVGAGILWRPKRELSGRTIDRRGYVTLTRLGMTTEDELLAEEFDLFRGRRRGFVKEHQLAAVKKYKRSIKGMVVRHLNGVKTDNGPENIILGTSAENTMDHNTARLMAMYWRNKYEELSALTAPSHLPAPSPRSHG